MAETVLMRNFGRDDSHTLAGYRATGGYGAWEKAAAMRESAENATVRAYPALPSSVIQSSTPAARDAAVVATAISVPRSAAGTPGRGRFLLATCMTGS